MFEGVVAYALNKYLGRFVEDLDSEQLNVGIFSGTVHLTDLHLKAEALAGLDLPVEVKGGCIGKISIDIPWTSLYYEPVLVHVEEVLVLAGPIADRKYDPEKDKRLCRALKSRRLEDAQPPDPDAPGDRPRGFMENLATTILNNVQVSLQNVHVRYEDGGSTGDPLACGLVLQNLTAVTTNNKWKATQIDADAKSLFKLLKVESLSLYWNPRCPANTLVKAQLNSDGWKTLLRKGLATFSINGEDFDFVVKPVSLKTKVILNKSKEAKVPKLLLDFVLQDAASQLSRDQFVSMYQLGRAFELMSVNQRFRKYFRGLCVRGHARDYWKDAYTAVLEEYIRPYTWSRIREHRNNYRRYKSMYKEHLHRPTDTELKLDLQLLEDTLDVTSILTAREQAKMEIAEEEPSMVRKVPTRKTWSFWSWFSSTGDETDGSSRESPVEEEGAEEELLIVGDRDRSWWSRMTAEERRRLFEGIGYERWGPGPEAELNHIGHKLNFTLANCTLSLINGDREILVATVTHFLSSLETRPGAKAYKVSARTESVVIEGASLENDLVPIITADSVTSGSNVPHVFALDFEKNPSQVNASYGLSVTAEPMEVVYHKYAVKEVLYFFRLPPSGVERIKRKVQEKVKTLAQAGREKIATAFAKHKMMHLNVDLGSPYFVVPEHGSLQRGGSVIVIDTGRLTVNTDLQSDIMTMDEPTKMEVEERLYDRFNVALSDIQVLFSDSGEEWRTAKQNSETDMHLVPKAKILLVFSNSVRPDCKTLPRQKLNVSIPSLKLNLSDRRISMIVEFLQNIPLPHSPNDEMDSSSFREVQLCSHTLKDPTGTDLKEVWKSLHQKSKPKLLTSPQVESQKPSGVLERSFSDQSDEEEAFSAAEHWARIIDLPGFEDNVSASNYIRILFRLVAGEVSIHLARSSDHTDKPYLMLRAEKLCVDAAHMEYGPALQASLHRIRLVDKLHKGSSGEYLELISSENAADMITVLYRKVQANCPEFKSHFHQVEHSFVLDVSALSVAFHREAFVTLARFLQYVAAKLKPKSSSFRLAGVPNPTDLVITDSSDPPVPPGATKFSISARMNALRVRLCDTDLELAELRVMGLETDYVLKANEKSVLRVDLKELSMEDLMEDTLYRKILSTEGDKVFDIKWVHRSPHHKEVMEGRKTNSLPVRVDGSLNLRFGRIAMVLLHSFANELHRFLEPFLNPDTTSFVKKSTEEKLINKVSELQQSGLRYQVSVEIQAPTVLFPQKATSPNALILQLGELSVENFFQEEQDYCMDNLLVRLHDLQLARAVILLDSRMEIREPILEPLKLRLDIKRALKPYPKDGLLYQVNGSMDLIKVNIGQRDLSSMIAIYQDNYSQLQFLDSHKTDVSPDTESGPEESVRKLEVFLFASTDVRRESSFAFIMEGLTLTLYADAEDLHSSSVRNPDQALTSFTLDEASFSLETTNDKTIELKCSCQAATLIDIRAPKNSSLRKIFQSYSGDFGGTTGVAGISLSMPPMVDLNYRRTATGDSSVNAVVEKIRLNVSVSYLLGVLKFVSDALPGSRLPSSSAFLDGEDGRRRLPSDCTSGYHSTVSSDEMRAMSVSVVFRKPEVVLFAQPDTPDTAVLVLKMDVMLDYNFNLGQGNFMLSVAGLHVLSCVYGRRKHTMVTVLQPCELELNRQLILADEEVKMSVSLTSLQLCLSAPVVQTVLQVSRQLLKSIQEDEDKRIYRQDKEKQPARDMWCPSSIYPEKWKEPECTCGYNRPPFILPKYAERLIFSVPEITVWCEITGVMKNVPVVYAKGAFEAEFKNWSTQMNASGEIRMEVMYYNEKVSTWEPFLEHVMVREGEYRPLEVMFKMFRDRAHPMVCTGSDDVKCNTHPITMTDAASASSYSSLSSSGNETEEEDVITTTVIRRRVPVRTKRLSSIAKSRDSSSFVAYPGDSDSENEDGVLEKIASTFDHLFSEDEEGASDDPPSDSEGIADLDVHSDSGETETADNEDVFDDAAPVFSSPHRHHEHRTVDPVVETAIYLTVDCRDTININITPSVISVVQEVLQEFTSPEMKLPSAVCSEEHKDLLLRNSLGPETTLQILQKEEGGSFRVAEETKGWVRKASAPDPDLVTPLVDISPADSDSEMAGDENDGFFMSGFPAPSTVKQPLPTDALYEEKSITQLYEASTQEKILIDMEGFDKMACLLPQRSATTIYALQPVKNKTRYFVLVSTEIQHGQRIVTVRSPLKITNHLGRPVQILCEKAVLESAGASAENYSKNPFQDKFVRLTTLNPGQIYDLPLLVAYHCKLYLKPLPTETDHQEYSLSSEGIWWKDMTVPQKSSKFLECRAVNNTGSVSTTKVVCEENRDLKTPSVGTKLVPNFCLHLYPPVVFHNLLPLALDVHIKSKDQLMRLQEGESAVFFDFDYRHSHDVLIEVGQYVGLQWHGKMTISGDTEEHHPISMNPETDTGGGNRHLALHVHVTRDRSLDLYIFAPYWIINKTGLPLQFRGAMSDAVYEAACTADPLLFRFKKHRKKKAKLRVYSSQWSRSFSLDTVGNCGVVICSDKERNKKYHFFVSIEMSKMLLTRVVVIKPFFLVVNNTDNHLRFMEKNEATDLWFDIAPDKSLPFWPDTDSMKMFVKLRDSKTVSQHFPVDFSHVTVLRMEHGSALTVEVKTEENAPTTISFQQYVPGDAPVRVDNCCEDLFLKIHQKSQSPVTLLNPYQSVLYTWDDPSQERTLIWNLYNRKKVGFPARISRDGYGFEKVSFHSLRKTLQQQPSVRTSSMDESSSSDDDSESEDGLLPKKTRKDKVVVHWVSYVEKEQRVLLFTQDDRIARIARKSVDGERASMEFFLSLRGVGVSLINDAYREVAYASLTSCPAIWEIEINHSWKLLTLELSAWLEDKWSADQHKAQLKEYLQVDLSKMQMMKPFFGQLRRFYSPAFWCQIRKSRNQTYAHLRIHRFQVDNQLPDAIFPTVLYPGTTPQYVVRRSGPKPFFETALLLHSSRSNKTLKFWKVLIQEMHLCLDKGFLVSLQDMCGYFSQSADEIQKLKEDMKIAQTPLYDPEQKSKRWNKKRYSFEYVHLSPIVVHFSFSPRGPSSKGDVVDLLLNSVGATLSEVKDVEIRLAFFERRGFSAHPRDLLTDARRHYRSQVIQQIYVLVLGLDILGNPFGLLKDFTRGLGDFFYEPYLGSVKGPDEFAESLARGAQSLLGHVIGGSAGAISLVTGSIGQTLSVLTFDDDYRKKRQQRLQLQTHSLPDALCTAAKSFIFGVVLGLSGIVVHPVTGGQQEGVEGFFRGIGKGLLGLITKPAGGVMDMVSMAFDGIRRAAEMGEKVVLRMRLPRYINPTEGLRPYSPYLASGCHLMEQVSKGHYAETDIYWAHAPLDGSRVALLTNRHMFLLEKGRFWGGWDIEWVVSVDDVLTVPHIQGNNLVIKVKQEDWILNFAGDERYIQNDNPLVLEWLKEKIEKVLLFNTREKPCPL